MFKKILVATDFSDASRKVAQCASGLTKLGVTEAILCHALDISPRTPGLDEFRNLNESLLEEQKALLEQAGMVTSVEVVTGPAPTSVTECARKHRCDLVVIGSHGASLAGDILLGGVAYGILHANRLPTLVIRLKAIPGMPAVCANGTCSFVEHVLFPTDFSNNAEFALPVIAQLAVAGVHQLTLIHVQDNARIEPHLHERLDEFNRIDRERLERLRSSLMQAGGCSAETTLCFGRPGPEIVRFAAEKNASLVVMGTQGRGALAEAFLGSVSHYVARHSPAPTLLIPQP